MFENHGLEGLAYEADGLAGITLAIAEAVNKGIFPKTTGSALYLLGDLMGKHAEKLREVAKQDGGVQNVADFT